MALNYIEFAAKIKEKYPQYKDVDDLTLAQKVVAKYPQYKETVIFDENIKPQEKVREIKPVNWDKDYTPSGLAKRGATDIAALLRMPIYGEDYKTARQNAQVNIRDFKEKHPVIMGAAELINDLAAYSKLPIAKGGGAVNFIKNAAIQGGVPGLLEGAKNNNALGAAAMGTGIGALVQGIAASGSGIGKTAGWLGNQYLQKAARLKPKTLEQVVKPDSKALDMTEDDVRKLLYDTAVRVRNNYKSVLNEKGNTVGNLLEELPETQKFKAADLKNLYDSILNNYSLSKNPALNPAKNATERELSKIKDLLYGDGKQRYGEFAQSIKDLEFPKNVLETITNRYKNTYHKKVLDNFNNDLVYSQRNFNKNILDKIRQNPELLQDEKAIADLEHEVGKYAKYPYEEANNEFYNKFYDALEKGEILKEGQNYINPKELYDINKNISNMINWEKADAALKNDVLEQLYLANAKKISDLSPALKAANKEYSDLMDFKKNDAVRSILQGSLEDEAKVGNALSALKNYNTTVLKGSSEKNIKDLEKILTDNGYKPFLNEIDDINAANNLLTSPETGINKGGGVDWLKLLARPYLRTARKANQLGIPSKIQELTEKIRPLGRMVTPSAVKATAPLLYGNAEYIENRN